MKRLIVMTLLCAATQAALAQGKGKIEMGVNTGLNFSSISDDQSSSDVSYGFNFGGSADYYFSNSWSLKVRLTYDRKGWDNDVIYDQDDNPHPTDYNLDYLTVPVLASWHFGPKDNWYLHFGPYVGFLMSAKDTRYDTDVKDNLNSTDVGIDFGIGVKIPVSQKLRLFVEYDGQGGFAEILKYNDYSRVTNSRSAINIGINFLAN